jgi:CRISPR-associated protein Cas4
MIPENITQKKDKKRLVSVSEINSWLFCARKLYIQKLLKVQPSMNRQMLIGMIKHSIFENFSNNEEKLVSQIDEKCDTLDIVFRYNELLKNTANSVFREKTDLIERFLVDKDDIFKKVSRDFTEDIKLRVQSIKESILKGFTKEKIWSNMDSLYYSEVKLESEDLGLKGRVDRVQVYRKNNLIIPYELKSREDNIFHSDELQLTAYAMLLEPKYHTKIEYGIVEVGNNRKEVPITEENRREVVQIVEAIRNIESNPVPPIQSSFNKCKTCDFREECMKL